MKILPNGDYQLEDGTIISREEITRQHVTAESSSKKGKEEKQELQEGQCSGKILLTD